MSVGDTVNTWSSPLDTISDSDNDNNLQHFECNDCAAGATTVTVTFPVNFTYRGIYIAEVTGVQNVANDGHNARHQLNPGTGANAVTSNTATNTATAFMLSLSVDDSGNDNVPSAGTGFTSDRTGWIMNTNPTARIEFKAGVSVATQAATFTAINAADDLNTLMVMFKEAADDSAALTGTALASITEADIVAGGKTIIATLVGDTFVPAAGFQTISYVGGKGAGTPGTGGGSIAIDSGLTGGSGGAPLEGDLVIVTVSVGTAARQPTIAIATPTGYTALTAQRTTSTTCDTNVQTCYKIMTSTPDTAVTIPASGNAADGISYTIQVFRGVDPTTPMDTAATYAAGQGTNNRPDPASITPVTAGAWIVICGGGAAATGTTLYTAGYLTNLLTFNGADTTDGTVGSGYLTWTSGAYDGAAFGGGSVNAANSWGCTTLALRPKATTPFADARAAARDGITSAQSEAAGWNAKVRPNIPLGNIVRTSNTVVTVTLQAQADYDITAQDVETWTIPGSILAGGAPIVATPTFTVDTGGPATYNESVTESLAGADAETGLLSTVVMARAEALAAADTEAGLLIIAASVAEALAASDAESSALTAVGALVETLASSDSQSSILTGVGSVAEALAGADSETGTLSTAIADRAEVLAVSDSQAGGLVFTDSVTDTMAASDSESAALTVVGAVTETLAATDAQSAALVAVGSVLEALAGSDSETGLLNTAPMSVTDALAATDSQQTGAQVNETLGATDSQSAVLVAVGAATETLAASDAESGMLTMAAARAEALAVADSETVALSVSADRVEALAAADAQSAALLAVGDRAEVLAASDAQAGLLVMPASRAEVLAATDSQTGDIAGTGTVYNESVTETLSASDSYSLAAPAAFQPYGTSSAFPTFRPPTIIRRRHKVHAVAVREDLEVVDEYDACVDSSGRLSTEFLARMQKRRVLAACELLGL